MRRNILKGFAGKALAKTIENRFKKVDYKLLTEPFFLRSEDDRAWRGEFWGKVIRPAITCAFLTGDPGLRALIDDSVADMMKTQTPDGSISTYPDDQKLTAWDIWGRKYAILGLIRYYELLKPDPAVLKCCCRAVDYLISLIGPGKMDILECGNHNGLPASSILGAVVSLWRLTGNSKYREFAQYIIERGCSGLGNIYECCDLGIAPAVLGNGKAYEMTSCFQGLAELAMLEENPDWQRIVVKYGKAVLEHEIFITGTGGAKDKMGEFWFDSALRQTRGDCGSLGETCVTVTWMRYCLRLLQLTDDMTFADAIEKALYNALLGAWGPDGSHWVHANPTPLTGGGYKKYAEDQIQRAVGKPFGGNDCCRAQGPEGLAVAAEFAVLESENSVTVNLFEALDSGSLRISGNYPCEPQAVITFDDPEDKVLRLRTPTFLKSVKFNGISVEFTRGIYLELSHKGGAADTVEMEFDFTLKEISSPDGKFTAVMRGPLVLAEDSRGKVADARVSVQWRGRELCDYATAGNLICEENTLTVWFRNEP
ncbi:MAG: glycoside hydrolase family 127 protein [Lentisphaeria bacterium]|nr:glycoside hydrolase family 127 protein [Lentisphaeria bacterium]